MAKLKKDDLEKILQQGQIAKLKLYQSMLMAVRDGKSLSYNELKTFHALEKEFESQSGVEAPAIIRTYDEAAKYCGFSKRTISYHLKKAHLRQNEDGTFDREELDKFLGKYGRRKPEIIEIGKQKETADLRYRIARAIREEIFVEQLKATLVSKEEISREWSARVAEVTSGLSNFGDRLPPLLEGKTRGEMSLIIREEVRNLREAYAREGRYCPNGK